LRSCNVVVVVALFGVCTVFDYMLYYYLSQNLSPVFFKESYFTIQQLQGYENWLSELISADFRPVLTVSLINLQGTNVLCLTECIRMDLGLRHSIGMVWQ
jgi:hypothetical protein